MPPFSVSPVSSSEVSVRGTTLPPLTRTEEKFSLALGSDGPTETFHSTSWVRADEEGKTPKGLVFLCHGFAEYLSPPYDHLGRVLASRGFLAFGHDHLGHGRTTGDRVQSAVDFKTDYVAPVLAHVKHRAANHPDVPVFIVGHSMGGGIAFLCGLEEPETFKGAVLNGPMIEVDPSIASPINKLMARLLSPVFPWLQVSGVKKELLSRDKGEVEAQEQDQLIWHGGMKLRQAWRALKALEEMDVKMATFKTALLLQHGEADLICRPEGSRRCHDTVASEDKTLTMYPGAFHSMYIEVEETREAVIKETADWIEARI